MTGNELRAVGRPGSGDKISIACLRLGGGAFIIRLGISYVQDFCVYIVRNSQDSHNGGRGNDSYTHLLCKVD